MNYQSINQSPWEEKTSFIALCLRKCRVNLKIIPNLAKILKNKPISENSRDIFRINGHV